MRFRDLDIPSDVVAAHRDGDLVIFVGAGASMSSPSNLPDFRDLVRKVALDSPEPDIDTERTDKALGDLEFRHGIDVHRRVADLLSDPSSRPNDTHDALARLAASSTHPRVVTTNFDHHLTTALTDIGRPLREFVGPAVPLGDEFEGLVYLHGKLGVDDSRLVLTDRDFGAAYLRDGWATRFLDRMFSQFHVLFVGYSHGDVTMEYLAKGLREHKRRFVLVPAPAGDRWARLELQAIPYELVDGESPHSALPSGLARWAERETAGLLGNDSRVAEIVLAPPPFAPEDEDFLSELLLDPVQVHFILERVTDPAWLEWFSQKPAFRALFARGSVETDPAARALAAWFGEWALTSEANSALALAVVHQLGGRLSPTLWIEIALGLHRKQGPRLPWMDPWLLLLIDDDPGLSRDLLDYAIEKTDWSESPATGLLLIEHLTRPRVRVTTGWGGGPDFDLETLGDAFWLDKARVEVLPAFMPQLASSLLSIADAQLRHARLLRSLYGTAGGSFDRDSFRRSAIEAHAQDQFREALDPVIDLARDCAEHLATTGGEVEAYVQRWADSDYPILRRLAVHTQGARSDLTADQRLQWLLDHVELDDALLHHEVFRLLGDNAATASADQTDQVAHRLRDDDAERASHRVFSLLVWLQDHGALGSEVELLIDEYRELHPEWQVSAHPDMSRWMDAGFVESRPPVEVTDFKNLVASDPNAALDLIRSFRGKEWSFSESSWEDAAALVGSLASTEPALSLTLSASTVDTDSDVREALIGGWNRSEALDAEVAEHAIEFLSAWYANMPAAVASLLSAGPTENFGGWWILPEAQRLARACWDALPVEQLPDSSDDWLFNAINHPAGHLALFWMQVLQEARREEGTAWTGIRGQAREALDDMVDAPDLRGVLSRVVIVSQARFLDAVDHDWTIERVLPVLDLSHDVSAALRNWHGFLAWGFWTEPLLESGLLTMYAAASAEYAALPERLRSQLALHLAALILRAEAVLDRAACAKQWSAKAAEETRVAVIEALGRILRDGSPSAADAAWEEWLGSYWRGRVSGSPMPLSATEATALVDLLPTFNASFARALDVAIASPASFREWSRFLMDLKEEQLLDDADRSAELLVHMVKNSSVEAWALDGLQERYQVLKTAASDTSLTALREAIVAYGITGARSW